jgi:hypothetical protein
MDPTDWAALARARGLEFPDTELDRVVQPLTALERVFRPLALQIPSGVSPAMVFRADLEQGE